MSINLDFEPVGRRGNCNEGDTILDCARDLGVDLINICGGGGSCGSCLVKILEGTTSEPTETETNLLTEDHLNQGYRLACHTIPGSDCKIHIPQESLTTPQRTQVEGEEVFIPPQPAVRMVHVTLTPPDLDDIRSDADRLLDELGSSHDLHDLTFDYSVLKQLSTALRSVQWSVNVAIVKNEIIAFLPPGHLPLGIAIDLGTTKIALYLVDLESGRTLASAGLMNPQIAYGEDILTRIAAIQADPQKAIKLQGLVVESFNTAILDLCVGAEKNTLDIVDAVIVGNTAMHHIFLGLPVEQLGTAPYLPAVSSALSFKARDVGLHLAPGANIHTLPNIAGFVGADHVAMLVATGITEKPGVVLAIDIGTNTEICLSKNGMLACLSTASGPAFEGAYIKFGMRAAKGAIERLRFSGDTIEYKTIGKSPPVGLCGSGILDVVAQLFTAGIIDRRGRLKDHPRVHGEGKNREFVIVALNENLALSEPITFSQKDIEQVQLAKGAIQAGIQLLMTAHGVTLSDIDHVILAGAFGTYLDVGSAVTIGLLPDIPRDRILQVGNAAGMGAKLALISTSKRSTAAELAQKVHYHELATDPLFLQAFAKAMYLGK